MFEIQILFKHVLCFLPGVSSAPFLADKPTQPKQSANRLMKEERSEEVRMRGHGENGGPVYLLKCTWDVQDGVDFKYKVVRLNKGGRHKQGGRERGR